MAIFMLMCLSSYCRPSEMMSLTAGGLQPPCKGVSQYWCLLLFPEAGAARSKTGLADVSIAMDTEYLQCLNPFFPLLREQAGANGIVWHFQYPSYLGEFKLAVKELGITEYVIPYQSRHSGPSIDVARRLRTLAEVQRRGQWKAQKSVLRYEKEARLTESWNHLPLHTRVLLEACESHLEDVLYNRRHGLALL